MSSPCIFLARSLMTSLTCSWIFALVDWAGGPEEAADEVWVGGGVTVCCPMLPEGMSPGSRVVMPLAWLVVGICRSET